ncbi:MAG TPA: hypothetical protein VE863_20740 [Pyrinomonadaceae bacterium]|nr:hypothetical protein [Pyrinomonadaceae bacterium]
MKRTALIILLLSICAFAKTPKLNIKLQHDSPGEQKRKDQIERLAEKYDLSKYTITRDIVIDQTAMNHSAPVLTQNLRFLDNDDRALSAYVHEQAHWLLMTRHNGQARLMLPELIRMYPNIDVTPPYGDGNQGTSYIHLVVLMLEWQALEDLIGVDRARAVMEFKRQDHYKDLYATVMDHRSQMEGFLKRYDVKW